MSIRKLTIALAIISTCAGLSAGSQAQEVKPGKQSSHITYSTSSFSAGGEADTDEDDSTVYLTEIKVKTKNMEVPVVSDYDSSNNLPNSLYVGTGICARAGLKSIGWVQDYGTKPNSSQLDRAQSDSTILAVKLDNSGKISKRIYGTVTESKVVGVYCIRSMPTATNYACQYAAAKNAKSALSDSDAAAQFASDVNACMNKEDAVAKLSSAQAQALAQAAQVQPEAPASSEPAPLVIPLTPDSN